MGKKTAANVAFHGLMVMLLSMMLQAGAAQAAVFWEDTNMQNTYNNDPNKKADCTEQSAAEQANAEGQYVKAVRLAGYDGTSDARMIEDAKYYNETYLDILYFCPIKITALTNLISIFSATAAGIMSAVYAALLAAVTTLINSIMTAICNFIMSTINGLLSSLFCLPNLNFAIKIPSFNFPDYSGASGQCAGTQLISVTGGPSIPNPPSNFGTSIPGMNWSGRISVIK